MKFQVTGKRTRVVTIVIEEEIDGEIDITKAEVMRVTDCKAKEDGDSTAWYDSVGEALMDGAQHKTNDDAIELERHETTKFDWDYVEVSW